MSEKKSSLSAGTGRLVNLDSRDELAARHGPQITPTVTSAQVARRRVARPKAPPLDDKWRITKRLAALRCAARAVMAIEVGGKVSKAFIFHQAGDRWSSHVHTQFTYYLQVAKAFVAELVAEILFAKKPPPKSREWDYGKFGREIENAEPRSQEAFAKVCLQETFDTLIRKRLAIVRIARALLERECLSGDEISPRIEAVDDLPWAREKLEAVLAQYPLLSVNGFENTNSMPFKLRQFAQAYLFCMRIEKTKTINHRHTSYFLKRVAEKYCRTYITNGAFIAGAIAAGFKHQRCRYANLNARFNMSEKSIDALQLEVLQRAK
jgi:hypothetical protein